MTEQPRSERKTQNRAISTIADPAPKESNNHCCLGESNSRDKTQTLKQAMMQDLLTGGIRQA